LDADCLVELELYHGNIAYMGTSALADLLLHPASKLHWLGLEENYLDDDTISSLCNAIITNKSSSLKQLSFGNILGNDVTVESWGAISKVLSHPKNCSIEELWLFNNEICDAGLALFGYALSNNTSLKYLNLNRIRSHHRITSTGGWKRFSKCLSSNHSALETLELSDCGLDDADLAVIVSAMKYNTRLKSMNLSYNSITTNGLIGFFRPLQTWKTLQLEFLNLRRNKIIVDELTDDDRSVFCVAMCGTTDIHSTHCSNHVFHTIILDEDDPWNIEDSDWNKCIHESLMLNKHPNKVEVARRKILKYHIYDEWDTSMFWDMHESVLPTALEWIGRDRQGFSAMYDVIREHPMLLDIMVNANAVPSKWNCEERTSWVAGQCCVEVELRGENNIMGR